MRAAVHLMVLGMLLVPLARALAQDDCTENPDGQWVCTRAVLTEDQNLRAPPGVNKAWTRDNEAPGVTVIPTTPTPGLIELLDDRSEPDGLASPVIRYLSATAQWLRFSLRRVWAILIGIYPVEIYGAKCDGTTNDTAAVTAAITAIGTNGGTLKLCGPMLIDGFVIDGKPIKVQLARGRVETTAPLVFRNTVGGQGLVGDITATAATGNGSRIIWSDAASGVAVIEIESTDHFIAKDFSISVESTANPILRGMVMANIAGGTSVNRNGYIENVVIDGISTGLQTGWEFYPSGAAQGAHLCLGGANDGTTCTVAGDCTGGVCAKDANNDQWTFVHTLSTNYTKYGGRVGHSQSYGHRLYGAEFRSGGSGAGINGLRIDAGSVEWFGGFVSGHSNADSATADVYVAGSVTGFYASSIQSENSYRALYTPGPGSAVNTITLDHWRWDGTSANCTIATTETTAPCQMVTYQGGGPAVTIRGGTWGITTKPLTFKINSQSAVPSMAINLEGVTIRSNADNPFQVNAAAREFYQFKNVSIAASRCVGGANNGLKCAVAGDCTGGTCTSTTTARAPQQQVANWLGTDPRQSVAVDMTALPSQTPQPLKMAARSMDLDQLGRVQPCVNIENPLNTDNVLIYRTTRAMTVNGLKCIVENATSATAKIQECDAAGDTCTDITSATACVPGGTSPAITDTAVAANAWLRLVVTAVSGTVGQLTYCVDVM
jgi:hypothetical protein